MDSIPKEYVCKNCGNAFYSNRETKNRTPKFCSRKCAGYKNGNIPINAGTAVRYNSCKVCGKEKLNKRERHFDTCQTCSNKARAKNEVYYECPRCGKPKQDRGRSDRVLCNSCAAFDRWKIHFEKFGINCQNKDYYGFTEKVKELVRDRHGRMCAFCGSGEGRVKHHVHHIDYDKKNSRLDNLLPLCPTCHMKTNFNREYWKSKCKVILEAIM